MDPLPLVACGTAAALYALGRRGKLRLWREVSFYSGVVIALVVLERPFDDWADRWLSAHMAQHIVLMTVVPPLVVHGRPWPRVWLPFSLAARRAVGGALAPSWILAIYLAFAPAPVYAAYPSLTDQQLAAGIMWVPGSLTYFVAAVVAFYRWLEPEGANAPVAEPRPEELSWT